jgi:cytochrome c
LQFEELAVKSIVTVWFVIVGALGVAAAQAATSDADAAKLMAKYNCQACHTVDQKLVGPAFRDVAKKYAGDATAEGTLEGKVKNGSTGAWGQVPMPPNNVPATDLTALVQWIVALK